LLVSQPVSWTYRPALDGLRSVAVYLVLLFHTGMTAFGGGFVGVDLFFVLSGFLVSNVILSEIDQSGGLRFGGFYARRIRRLLPAALVVVVATSALFLLIAPFPRRLPLVQDAQSALLYVANWNFLGQQNDYFATGVAKSPFLHFWSLAIEEQFYAVFPLLLLVLVTAARRKPWALPTGLGVLFALSLAAQLYWARVDVNHAYYGTDARLYQLLAGALLAVGLRALPHRPRPARAHLVAVAGLVALLVLASGLHGASPSWTGIGATVASVAVLCGIMSSEDRLLGRLLSRRAPVYLGKVSYGTYLWHWPVILVLEQLFDVRPVVVAALALVVSTALAALSFEMLELPLRTAKPLHRFRWSAVVAGVTASAVAAVTVVPVLLASERTPRLAATAAASIPAADLLKAWGAAADGVTQRDRRAPVPKGLNYREIMKDLGPSGSCTESDPSACIVVKGKGAHLTLIGDSHARMLAPVFIKLAKEHDLTLSLNVMPGCPWQEDLVIKGMSERSKSNCDEKRRTWYAKTLPFLDPDLVVLATDSRDDPREWEGNLVRVSGKTDESLGQLNFDTTMETVNTIVSTGSRALIVDNMLGTDGVDPLDCLASSRRLEQCEVPMPAERPISDAYYQIAANQSDKVFTVDINPIVCVGEPLCLPVVDGTVVWRNKDHFTTKITTRMREPIWRAIKDSGALDGL
jgi:peptidoglycan/LPS O-acetylase OafA/YrhL